MTVEKYQKIYEISQTTPDDIERVAWLICYVFDLTEDKVNDFSELQFLKYVDKLNRKLRINAPWFNKIRLQTDASKITFGQFIECSYWLRSNPIEVAHLVSASLLIPNMFIDKQEHQTTASMILTVDIACIYDQLNDFVESLNNLIKSYKGLFEIEELPEGVEAEKPHQFLDQYGWIYSATQVADHEKITLDQAFELPIIQALNVLSYLKAKQQYDKYLAKQ